MLGAKDLKLSEEKKENPYATSQAWGYLKSAVESIIKQEGINLCTK